MYDHIGLEVSDLAASVRFYSAVLGELGHVLASRDASAAGLGP
jgi:catechol 2,3-dioxygenase-like lactoylglutathione lyase family enzyme